MLYPVAMSAIAVSMVFLPMIPTNVVIIRWLAVINLLILVVGGNAQLRELQMTTTELLFRKKIELRKGFDA
ncbi:hypothetical protein RB195_002765 [Necator americanus]|uniref:Uncharacterized protein n=1 Tax=Necator americanus TaxID=51031 RepID=A0ABR1DKK7_NECAM